MERVVKASYPRDIAVRVLTRVLSDHETLEEAFSDAIAQKKMSAVERAWLQEITSGTLRWKGRLDLAIDSAALKKRPSGWLRKILLLGAYQLIVQDRANPGLVVSETVDEIKKKEGDSPAKFANAVLRKIADHSTEWRALSLSEKASDAEKAAWASLPEWLWNKCFYQQGLDFTTRFAEAALERPMTWIRAREEGDFLKGWTEKGPIPGSYSVQEGGLISEKPGFTDGQFFVQDISSQVLILEIVDEVRKALGSGFTALDLCAAPGGKAIGLAWSGVKVTATDRDGERVKLLQESIARAAKEVNVISRSEVQDLPEQDLVWVDAPCTGTGIIRRHPDVRWLKSEAEIVALTKTQEALILEAWQKVRPGGFLAYTVCSVLREEGSGLIEKILKKMKRDEGTQIRTWFLAPHLAPHGDGFWGTLIKKSGQS